jgi:formate hydrogenlyase subunit 3/multisubunit Na+/H+ antiporter MnhD subunit
MNQLLYPIIVPVVLGIICLIIPQKIKFIREFLALAGSACTFGITVWLFTVKPLEWSFNDTLILRLDQLSSFILLASGLFGFLITLYSIQFMHKKKQSSVYYGSLLLTLGAASAAKKTLIIVGGSDALLLLAIAFLFILTSTFEMDKMQLHFNGILVYFSFIMLALCAFAKAGAMPLHTWIPDVAETAPIPVTAYLPAALDKLLGIYLLGRMCLHLFVMNSAMNLLLMIVGSITIIAAVMMALIQHDLRRLLAYHAVSQVGYMVLGIGTGNPIGIAGGIFHMLNHSIYKACLFLSGGAVQHRAGTTDLDKLGGLGKLMPVTFISFLIAAFAISGIPPFNGFVSKWMVYQGLIEMGQIGNKLWLLWLIAAMFGSGLTLASFMKLTHSVFLGVPNKNTGSKSIREVGFGMALPMVILALLCVVFGIFAFSLPLKHFLLPAIPGVTFDLGLWSPGLATIMIIIGLVIGFLIYLAGNLKGIREADSFIGGEKLSADTRVTGTGFYNTIKEMGLLKRIYMWAESKWFDIYDQGSRLFFSVANLFRKAHTGVLNSYFLWVVMGLIVFFIVAMVGR